MSNDESTSRVLWWVLAGIVAVRMATLGWYPLTDTTEARYAEIARVMLSTGDWITPRLAADVPFWGKPPLYAWLTAGSFYLFGQNEFGARLPQFLLSMATLLLLWRFVLALYGAQKAQLSVLILASSCVFFVAAGAVMTDMSLLFCTTLSMTSFWFAVHRRSTAWSLMFFAGLGLGLLAKGPVAAVLVTLPVLLWLGFYRAWRQLANLRWGYGIVLAGAIALPWYAMAELKTPGFLNYFLIGEHFMRFVQPGWSGDLYGSAHDRAAGAIWLYWLIAALPWAPKLLLQLLRLLHRRQLGATFANTPAGRLHGYLLFWMFAPMLFFTFAGNILPAYVLPGVPALAALLASDCLVEPWNRHAVLRVTSVLSMLAPVLFLALLLVHANAGLALRTEKYTVMKFDSMRSDTNVRLYYVASLPLSAAFYSRGQARLLSSADESVLHGREYWVALREDREPVHADAQSIIAECERIAVPQSQRYALWQCD